MTTYIASTSGGTIDGSSGNDVIIGKSGDDIINGGAGSDILLGGAGNDIIYYDEFDIRIDGGTGYDILLFNGMGQSLDLGIQKTVMNFEQIVLGGGGNHSLTFSAADVLRTSDIDSLLIHGTQTSHVNFSDTGWHFQSFSNGLSTFVNGSAMAYVDFAVQVTGFSGNANISFADSADKLVVEDESVLDLTAVGTAGSITVSDPNGQNYLTTYVTQNAGTLGKLTLGAGIAPGVSDGSYMYSVINASTQYLAQDQEKIESFTVASVDGTTRSFSFAIRGINDTPVRIGDQTQYASVAEIADGAPGENATLHIKTGSFTVRDVDLTDSLYYWLDTNPMSPRGSISSVQLGAPDSNGDRTIFWTYSVEDARLDSLRAGILADDAFLLHISDRPKGAAGASIIDLGININLTGEADQATFIVPTTDELTEDEKVTVDGNIVSAGAIKITDPDSGEDVLDLTNFNGKGVYGTLSLDPYGSFSYVVDNSSIDGLNIGDKRTETFTIHSWDGTPTDISFTINGKNDAPTLRSEALKAEITEASPSLNDDGSLPVTTYTASGHFSFTDVDNSLSGGFQVYMSSLANAPGQPECVLEFHDENVPVIANWSVSYDDTEFNNIGAGANSTYDYKISIIDPNGGIATQVVSVTVHGADDPIMGDGNANVMIGTASDDLMSGLAGDDQIDGLDGNDLIYGGSGNDTLTGGPGTNTLIGGVGNDIYIIDPQSGLDHSIIQEAVDGGTDTILVNASFSIESMSNIENLMAYGETTGLILKGNGGNNVMAGTHGPCTLFGLDGDDTLMGDDGNDVLYGGAGKDVLNGGVGKNILYGGDGDDEFHTIYAYTTDEILLTSTNNAFGESGNDTFFIAASMGSIDGGDGDDKFIFNGTWGTISLTRSLDVFGSAGKDVFDFSIAYSTDQSFSINIKDIKLGEDTVIFHGNIDTFSASKETVDAVLIQYQNPQGYFIDACHLTFVGGSVPGTVDANWLSSMSGSSGLLQFIV